MFSCFHYILKITLLTTTLLFFESGLNLVIPTQYDHKIRAVAIAQETSYDQQQVKNYAEALLAIEPLRQRTFREIQTILDSEQVPTIACNRSQSYRNLTSEARSLITNYCDRSKEIVQQKGLTVAEFNAITTEVKSNPELKEQVQAEMLELQ